MCCGLLKSLITSDKDILYLLFLPGWGPVERASLGPVLPLN